jgi:formylmethanofuran dehydrogenase subunit D
MPALDSELLLRARDGAVLPIAAFPDEITFQHVLGVTTGRSWEPIKPGVASDESHLASLGTGVVEATGTGADTTIKPGLVSGEAPEDVEASDAAVESASDLLAARPELHRWDRAATAPAAAPPDAYSLRLVAARTLYDAGRIVSASPSLAALATGVALVVHPSDLGRIGVSAEGDDVRVTSARGTVTLPVLADAATAPGTAFIPFAQRGAVGANDLIDITASVTELRVETTR